MSIHALQHYWQFMSISLNPVYFVIFGSPPLYTITVIEHLNYIFMKDKWDVYNTFQRLLNESWKSRSHVLWQTLCWERKEFQRAVPDNSIIKRRCAMVNIFEILTKARMFFFSFSFSVLRLLRIQTTSQNGKLCN